MSTRSLICYTCDGYYFSSIYCHWDGYPSYMECILLNHYQDENKVIGLMNLGNLSSLGYELGTQHSFDDQSINYCTAYFRDRGERNQQAKPSLRKDSLLKVASNCHAQYIYLFSNGHWSWRDVRSESQWTVLTKDDVTYESTLLPVNATSNLPTPNPLSIEEMNQATREARELREKLSDSTLDMESIPNNVRLK